MSGHSNNSVSSAALAAIAAAVAGLYVLVLAGVGSPFWSALVGGEPVGVESILSEEDTASAQRLDAAFARMGYRLDLVAKGGATVPPLFLPAVPADLAEVADPDTKKAVFLRVMLPLVLVVNEEVAEDRRRLADLAQRRARGEPLAGIEQSWVEEMAARYELPESNLQQSNLQQSNLQQSNLQRLMRRVDVVPPSLALAQAAEESGWGTSRFVRQGNNLFGHIAAGDDGMVPTEDGAGPRMRAFGTLHEAVRAYVHNLNTHRAYEGLRRSRAAARARGAFPDGHTLAAALSSYSERGPAYVDTIRALIRANGLLRFDHARINRPADGRMAGRMAGVGAGGLARLD